MADGRLMRNVCLRFQGYKLDLHAFDDILGVRGFWIPKPGIRRRLRHPNRHQWSYAVPNAERLSVPTPIDRLLQLAEPKMEIIRPILEKTRGKTWVDIGFGSTKLMTSFTLPTDLLLMIALLPAELGFTLYKLAEDEE